MVRPTLHSFGWYNTRVNCVLRTPFLYTHAQPVVLNKGKLLGKIKNLNNKCTPSYSISEKYKRWASLRKTLFCLRQLWRTSGYTVLKGGLTTSFPFHNLLVTLRERGYHFKSEGYNYKIIIIIIILCVKFDESDIFWIPTLLVWT